MVDVDGPYALRAAVGDRVQQDGGVEAPAVRDAKLLIIWDDVERAVQVHYPRRP